MTPVDQYIYSKPPDLRDLLDFLNVYILAFNEGFNVSLKWSVPYYKLNNLLCYVNVVKGNKVELNFSKASLFQEELKGILEFRGRTVIGGVGYRSLEDVEEEILEILLLEAIRIDQQGIIR
ncbi:MAG: DUF5655 domain-containing protein [Saprospiraceae bacterium]|nr:DUF5655 domain-containing protein [Saprospiraceae bacterium]